MAGWRTWWAALSVGFTAGVPAAGLSSKTGAIHARENSVNRIFQRPRAPFGRWATHASTYRTPNWICRLAGASTGDLKVGPNFIDTRTPGSRLLNSFIAAFARALPRMLFEIASEPTRAHVVTVTDAKPDAFT